MRLKVLLLLTLFQLSFALDCFICNSISKTDCASLSKTSLTKVEKCKMNTANFITEEWLRDLVKLDDSDGGNSEISAPLLCHKMILKKDGHQVVYRGCHIDGGKTDVCELTKRKAESIPGLSVKYCELCKEDGCNKSNFLTPYTWIILIILLLLKLIN